MNSLNLLLFGTVSLPICPNLFRINFPFYPFSCLKPPSSQSNNVLPFQSPNLVPHFSPFCCSECSIAGEKDCFTACLLCKREIIKQAVHRGSHMRVLIFFWLGFSLQQLHGRDPMKMGLPTMNNADLLIPAASANVGPGLEDPNKKVRKPYTITKSRESWIEQEHDKFPDALQLRNAESKLLLPTIETGHKVAVKLLNHHKIKSMDITEKDPWMDNIIDSLNNAYEEFISAAASYLEAKENSGGKTLATDVVLEDFRQRWELFRVACDQADEFVEAVKQRIGFA